MNREYLIIPDFEQLQKSEELAQQYGAGFEYNDFCNPEVYENEAEIRRRCQVYMGLKRDRSRDTLHGVFLDIAVTSMDTVIREHSRKMVEQSMEIAGQLGVRGVVFHTGLLADLQLESYLDKWLYESAIFWQATAERYPETEIYLENTFEKTPDMLLRLKERLNHINNFRLCLDYGHACLTPTPVESWVDRMQEHTGHIHLNDNDLTADLHQAPGDGKIDFVKCKKLLDKSLEQVPILLEITGIEKQKKALEYMTAL